MWSPLLVGGPKIVEGLCCDRPVGFLVAGCVVTLLLGVLLLFWNQRCTPLGDQVFAEYQCKYETFRSLPSDATSSLASHDMAMMVGLFNASMLAAGPLSGLQRVVSHASGNAGCGANGGCGSGGGGRCGGGGGGVCGGRSGG